MQDFDSEKREDEMEGQREFEQSRNSTYRRLDIWHCLSKHEAVSSGGELIQP